MYLSKEDLEVIRKDVSLFLTISPDTLLVLFIALSREIERLDCVSGSLENEILIVFDDLRNCDNSMTIDLKQRMVALCGTFIAIIIDYAEGAEKIISN